MGLGRKVSIVSNVSNVSNFSVCRPVSKGATREVGRGADVNVTKKVSFMFHVSVQVLVIVHDCV